MDLSAGLQIRADFLETLCPGGDGQALDVVIRRPRQRSRGRFLRRCVLHVATVPSAVVAAAAAALAVSNQRENACVI